MPSHSTLPLTRRRLLQAGAATALAGTGLHALAAEEAWPAKIVKMVVAFPAGGPTDTAARIVSQKLAERLGAAMVVDNRPGASGSVGTASFIKSPPDGNTLSMFGMPALLAPLMYNNNAYDVEKDFQCVSTVYDLPMAIVVNPSVMPGVDSVQAMIAQAKAAKPALNYTSSGTGSFGHLAMEQLKDLGGFDMQHVPYKGGVPAITDTIGGQVPVMYADLVAALPHVQAGKLRALAVGSPRRLAMLPDVPTIAEQGFQGYDAVSWGGLMAPRGTPKAVVDRVAGEVRQILAEKDVQDRLLGAGAIAHFQDPAQMSERVRQDYAKWGGIIRDKGIVSE